MHRRPDGTLILAATDLVGFLHCGHLTQLDRAVAAGHIRRPDRSDDPEVELLQRRGTAHEQRYLDELRRDREDVADLSGPDDLSFEEKAARTMEQMRGGADVIYQAFVFDGRWIGYPDFLLRTPGASALGDYHYEVADTKLAHAAKASALIQIASYVEQIERIQERRPDNVYVVTGGAKPKTHPFRTAEMMAYYRHAKERFERVLDEATVGPRTWPIPGDESYPDPVDHCDVCKYFLDYCRVAWRNDDALPRVAGITRQQRTILTTHGTTTMTALSELTQPLPLSGLKHSQLESIWNRREQARLQVASERSAALTWELLQPDADSDGRLLADRGLSALPEPSPHDLFFDIEGDPFAFWEGLEYLFGLWDGGKYRCLWALDREREKLAFEQLMKLFVGQWREHPDMHIYHYAPYEPTALKRLAGRHATMQEELDELLRHRVFVDLYRVVRQGVRVGADGYSIKDLEPLYGFRRDDVSLRSAGKSIVEFELWLAKSESGDGSDEDLLKRIELYNRDDCVSAAGLRDWLEARRLDAATTWGELPRPPIAIEEEPSAQLSDWIRRVNELTDRLTKPITPDPLAQTPEHKAIWLVAHLLDWHRREDKSTWWRYYDLLSKTDEELVEEAEPIGGLEYRERSDPGGRSRSYVYRYAFPTQEHKIELGYVDDPQLEAKSKRTGELVAIDEKAGTLDIRRARTWTGQHPKSLVQVNYYDPKDQRESLMRLGEWVAANAIDSDSPEWRAARDLVLRRPPRVLGMEPGGRLVGESETGSAAACRLATQLDATTLAIQGPPGSGKTYIGARMVLELVRAGRKVGITSNSHKVIANMVEAVLEAGSARIIQRGKDTEVFAHPSVKRAGTDQEVADGLASGEFDIGAGTPWLWSGANLAGSVDTLFVDEAGQVSLANVLAVSSACRNLVLLGDPQQLDQPTQGVHPGGSGVSALTHLLGDMEVMPPERGLFLERTWRMHPLITAYTSELFYDARLEAIPGLERQEVLGSGWLAGSGLRWVPVAHDGNTNLSVEEAERVSAIWHELVGRDWVNAKGVRQPLTPGDIVIVSPFNAHRLLIENALGPSARVGTVDKFQGQQAAVAIYTMATSRPEDAPRGMSFLYSLNRLNVATSRARALAIVVASPELLRVVPRSTAQLRMANGLVAFVDFAGGTIERPVRPASDFEDAPDDGRPTQLAMGLA